MPSYTPTARPRAYLTERLHVDGPDVLGATTLLSRAAADLIASLTELRSGAAQHNFSALRPDVITGGAGGAVSAPRQLFAGMPARVRFARVPDGVNGSDADHYLRIVDSSSEAVLITGGAGTSGQLNGEITFTPASNHSGSSWTVTSASSGIKEADIASGTSVPVYLSAGTYPCYAPVKLSAGTGLIGSLGGVYLTQEFATGHLVQLVGAGASFVECTNVYFQANVTVDTGYYFLFSEDTNVDIAGIQTVGGYGGIWHNGSQGRISRCFISGHTGIGIRLGSTGHASGPTMSDIVMSTSEAAAISLVCDVGLCNLSNFDFQLGNAASTGGHILINGGFSEATFANGILDGGLYRISGGDNGSLSFNIVFSDILCTGGAQADSFGIITTNDWLNFSFNNIQFVSVGSATKPTITINGSKTLRFTNVVAGAYVGASSIAVAFGTALSVGVSFENCELGVNLATGLADANCATSIDFGSLNHTDLTIQGGKLYAPVLNAPTTRTHWRVGGSLSGLSAADTASAATVTLPVMCDGSAVIITGNTGIGTIQGISEDQFGFLIFTHAAPAAVTAGATIGNTFTATQNVPVPFVVKGGKLYGQA